MSGNDLISVEEACEILGISPATLARIRKEYRDMGKPLEANTPNHLLKRPKKWFFKRGDIEALLRQPASASA